MKIPSAISSKLAMVVLKTQKHSPTLLLAGGIVGIVGTVVLASRATLRVDEVLTDAELKMKEIKDLQHAKYSEEDRVKDQALVYVQTAVKVVKLYAPAVVLGSVSIGMLIGSHNILNRRNAALTAAYAALEKGFRAYRNRVIEDAGIEKDREYMYGVENDKVVHISDDGKKKMLDKKVATRSASPYAVLFHEGNPNYNQEPAYNYLFIKSQQKYLNDKLNAYGFVLLNDAYDVLGFDRTSAGCVVGWLRKGKGDGFIDFGIFDDVDMLRVHDYITGREGELWLDFNVDGTIYDKI